MGTDRVEFGSGELRIAGGDYGQVILEGTTEEARRTVEQIVEANRRSGDRNVVCYFIVEFNDTPDLFEDRHAGRESTSKGGASESVVGSRGPQIPAKAGSAKRRTERRT